MQNIFEKTPKEWKNAQNWEKEWHGNCTNSLNEELKQLVYAEKMGLILNPTPKTPYNFDLKGTSVLDIGGGAYSLLLKCTNYFASAISDPLMAEYPTWVLQRYQNLGINVVNIPGEEIAKNIPDKLFDEVWLYNVLEHTYDPKKILENALRLGKIVRIFEWLDTPPNIGHPQSLDEKSLNKWLGGEGKVEYINKNGASGKAYFGVFKGNFF